MENKIMPKTNKVIVIDETLSVEQTTLKRGKAVQDLQTKHDVDSKLMSFMKIKLNPTSAIMEQYITDVNQACENLASSLTDEYDVEVFDGEQMGGDGFFTEVIEGMKAHNAVALDKVQSDARRTVLIETGQVPLELWTATAEASVSVGVSSELSALVANLKK
jgi:hypothetical protein